MAEDFEVVEASLEIMDNEEQEFYEMIHSIWFSLFEELDDGGTIMGKFIQVEAGKIKRPKLKHILQTWTSARTIAGTVIAVDENKLTIEDGFTSEHLEAINLTEPLQVDEGSFMVGILLPFEQQYVFFPGPLELPDLNPDLAISYIEDSSLDADYDSPQEYLTDFFVEVVSELPMAGGLLEIDEIDWPAPIYKEVADLFKEQLEIHLPPHVLDMGLILWYSFCKKKQKRIQNPNIYAAALHYLLSTLTPLDQAMTQKELAQQYGVSARSISSVVSELAFELEEDIGELLGLDNPGKEDTFVLPKAQ